MARILIVEDNDQLREEIKEIVTELGYDAITVENVEGEQYAITVSGVVRKIFSGEDKYDVVLMDNDLNHNPENRYTRPITGNDFAESLGRMKGRQKLISISGGEPSEAVKSLYDCYVPKDMFNIPLFKEKLGLDRLLFQKN